MKPATQEESQSDSNHSDTEQKSKVGPASPEPNIGSPSDLGPTTAVQPSTPKPAQSPSSTEKTKRKSHKLIQATETFEKAEAEYKKLRLEILNLQNERTDAAKSQEIGKNLQQTSKRRRLDAVRDIKTLRPKLKKVKKAFKEAKEAFFIQKRASSNQNNVKRIERQLALAKKRRLRAMAHEKALAAQEEALKLKLTRSNERM